MCSPDDGPAAAELNDKSSNLSFIRGQQVEFVGMRNRANLNGVTCRVADSNIDDNGCVLVTLSSPEFGAQRKHMKVHQCRLRPTIESVNVPARSQASISSPMPARSRSVGSLGNGPSVLSSAAASELLKINLSSFDGTMAEKQHLFMDQRAAWHKKYVKHLMAEVGMRHRNPLNSTDATQFEDEFRKANGGLPIHKVYKKQVVALKNPRDGMPAPPWAP